MLLTSKPMAYSSAWSTSVIDVGRNFAKILVLTSLIYTFHAGEINQICTKLCKPLSQKVELQRPSTHPPWVKVIENFNHSRVGITDECKYNMRALQEDPYPSYIHPQVRTGVQWWIGAQLDRGGVHSNGHNEGGQWAKQGWGVQPEGKPMVSGEWPQSNGGSKEQPQKASNHT